MIEKWWNEHKNKSSIEISVRPKIFFAMFVSYWKVQSWKTTHKMPGKCYMTFIKSTGHVFVLFFFISFCVCVTEKNISRHLFHLLVGEFNLRRIFLLFLDLRITIIFFFVFCSSATHYDSNFLCYFEVWRKLKW